MQLDKNDFFRQATMRICGNLDIEIAMKSCFHYINKYIPAEGMYLLFFHPERNVGEVIASFVKDKKLQLGETLTMPDDIRGYLLKVWSEIGNYRICNNREDYIESQVIADLLGVPEVSLMGIRLEPSGERVGLLAVYAYGNNKY